MKIFRLTVTIIHFFVVVLLLGTLMNAYVSPKTFAWLNLLSLAFPVLMIINIILCIFWIVLWKKRAFLFLILSLMLINPTKRWINFTGENAETPNLKIVSLNVKGGKLGVKEIQKYINQQNPDIVLLQEDGNNEFNFNYLTRKYKIFVVSLYSKYEVVGHKELFKDLYSSEFNAYADQTDIEINRKMYRLINVYLQPFMFEKSMIKLNGDSEQDEKKIKNIVRRLIPTFKIHQEQIKIIRTAIDESPYPVILAGDFNAVPNSYEYYSLGKNLKDVFVETGNGSATSFHDYKFPIRIDFVFCSKELKPVSYKVDRSVKLSDHFPVITTFKID